MTAPERGFPETEYRDRLGRAQKLMVAADLAALFLTTEPEIRYFTGFLTRFWESPTRPWFLIVPASGAPVAVIPSIGARLMGQTWITDIRTWHSPDDQDDGIGLVASTLRELVGPDGLIGVPSGPETHLRLPLADWQRLKQQIAPLEIYHDFGIMRDLRLVKSPREIAKIRQACRIANQSFARVPDLVRPGLPLADAFRLFQVECLTQGADWVGYLAGGVGPGGYGDVISPASDAPLQDGDVLMLDTGVVWDGYFCDFDRNWAIGSATDGVADGYKRLIDAADAAFEAARPGKTAADLYHVVRSVLQADCDGRLGHGLGMQLTEWPSLLPEDQTPLREGMVLTIEPYIELSPGRILVHEENIAITGDGAVYLSDPASGQLPVLRAAP